MASIDSLPPDQRAVLQLVLQRGRTYDQIAQLLSIDRTAVRQRALAALDALGPSTRLPSEQRAVITDYLLGQLPDSAADETRNRLAESASERAWARVVASELGTMATQPLPEIPVDGAREAAPGDERASEPDATAATEPAGTAPAARAPAAEPVAAAAAAGPATGGVPGGDQPPSSRRGGALLLGGGAIALIAIIVVVILLVSGGSSKKNSSTNTAASAPATTAPATSTTTSGSATASARPVAQVNLISPTAGSKTKGAAVVVKQGTTTAVEIIAQAVPPNTTHDAYAVWLYNSASDSKLLGFVNPGIKQNGVLRTLGPLPANASHFKQLLVTRETQAKPTGPGTIILQGALNLPGA